MYNIIMLCLSVDAVEEVMLDLMHTSALLLRTGGTLAYLIPTPYNFSTDQLPIHPCLSLQVSCCQSLSTRHGRHLVVMRKIKEYDESAKMSFYEYKQRVLSGADEGFGKLMEKLQTALSNEAYTDDSVIKRISSTCAKRKINKLKQRSLGAAGVVDREIARENEELEDHAEEK
jgi:SNF2 family DNA or RNA helicase